MAFSNEGKRHFFMEQFFYPQSLAVIGASQKEGNLARNIIKNCMEFGYKGNLLGVGKKPGNVFDTPILDSVEALPEGIDLAVILTPVQSIPGIMRKLGKIGVQRIIIETGGFGEFDPSRQAVEKQILEIIRRYDQHVIGPNCLGIINMESGLCTPFAPYRRNMPTGNVSFVSQSGGMGRAFFSVLENEGIGLNKFVSMGNKLDIGEAELLQYLLNDPETRIIFMYLEDLREGREFLRVATSSDKPILVHKSNRGQMGSAIALSHTKAMATDDHVVDAALDKAGAIRINKTYELGKFLKAFSMPALRGPNIMVISRSGGHAVVTADACERQGLHLPPLPPGLVNRLQNHLRANVIRLQNPLDMGDVYDLKVFLMAVEEVLKQESIHGVVFILVYPEFVSAKDVRELIPGLIELMEQYQKPVAAIFISSFDEVKKLKQEFRLPIFSFSEEAVEALAVSYQHYLLKKIRQEPTRKFQAYFDPAAVALLKKAKKKKRNLLLHESFQVLDAYGLPITPYQLVQNPTQAVNFAHKVGLPVVLKVVSQKVLHKSKHDGVRLHLDTFAKVRKAFKEMETKMVDCELKDQEGGIVIQKMIPAAQEVILGARRDPNLGPVVAFGLGGIFTELFRDIVIRLAPLNRSQVKRMITQLKIFPLLTKTGQNQGVDLKQVEECLLKVSDLITSYEEIVELDINPLILSSYGNSIVDARIILQ
jgi:acetyltransferase